MFKYWEIITHIPRSSRFIKPLNFTMRAMFAWPNWSMATKNQKLSKKGEPICFDFSPPTFCFDLEDCVVL